MLEAALVNISVFRVKLANDVTFRRMNQTMQQMQKLQDSDQTTLMRICFGTETPTPLGNMQDDLTFFDETLNESQKDAVRFALTSREVALIHGPPGVRTSFHRRAKADGQ